MSADTFVLDTKPTDSPSPLITQAGTRVDGPFVYNPKSNETWRPSDTAVDTTKREVNESPSGEFVPIAYGRRRIPGMFVYLKIIDTFIHGIWIFCEGEIEAFDSLLINDKEFSTYPPNITAEFYTGTDTQPVCGLKDYDFSFNSAFPGIAYVYIQFRDISSVESLPKIEAVGRWKKIYDPRITDTVYSSNPALCLADIHTNPKYGNSPINWDSVKSCADYCDELLGTSPNQQKRYEFNSYFSDGTIADVINVIKLHFLGALYPDGNSYTMHAMRPKVAVASFSEFDSNGKKEIWDFNIPPLQAQDFITRIRYSYTDPTTWEQCTVTPLDDPDINTGEVEIHDSSFDLTGCLLLSQAQRIATTLLNMRLSDLQVQFKTYNSKGLQPWDVFTLTHSLGLADKLCYCTRIAQEQDGSFVIEGREYDPAFFSDTIVEEPTYPDTNLPNPSDAPPIVQNLHLSEDLIQLKDSSWISMIDISWVPLTWPFLKHYEVWYKKNYADYLLGGITTSHTFSLGPVEELATYTIKIIAVSFWDVKSVSEELSITPQGKYAPPVWKVGAVLLAEEAGDIVILSWVFDDNTPPAIDIDIAGYEIRRGIPSDTWESAMFVAFIDALVFLDRTCPSGTWRYFIKAQDSVGNMTDTALYADVTVTLNPNLGFQYDRYFDLATMTGTNIGVSMGEILTPIDPAYDTLGERFPGTLLGTGVGGLYTYLNLPAPATANAISTQIDLGQVLPGEFSLHYTAQKIGTGSASVTPKLLLSVNGTNWVEYDISVPFISQARYAKVKFIFASSSLSTTYIIREPVYLTLQMDPREDYGEAHVDSGGSAVVTFGVTFISIEKIYLTILGSVPKIALADNLTITGFTLRLFSTSGVPTSGDCKWKVEGF